MPKKKKEIWIESMSCGSKGLVMQIGSEWGCTAGFSRAEYRKLFEAVKTAVEKAVPGVTVNPWSDSEPGTVDFE